MKDLPNIVAIGAAAVVVLAVAILQPNGTVLAIAGTLVGGCVGFLQRRDVP